MTQYQLKLIEFYTKDGRKPVFIEKDWEITKDTPLEDILYTYNEMPCRGYLQVERGYFLENARYYSGKDSFCFLYPDIILDVPFELHPYVIASRNLIEKYKKNGGRPTKEELEEIHKLKDY